MNKFKIANILLRIAKYLEAEYEYKSDPDHKQKPKGGGWKQTDKGWSKSDNSIQKTYSDISKPNPYNGTKPEQYGDINAPVRRFIVEISKDHSQNFSQSEQQKGKEYQKHFTDAINRIDKQMKIYYKLKEHPKMKPEREKYFYRPKVRKILKQKQKNIRYALHTSNLELLSIPAERRGKLKIESLNLSDHEANQYLNKGIKLFESIIDKNMIPNCKLSCLMQNFETNTARSEYWNNHIMLYDDAQYDISTIVHEIGHFIEHNSPGVMKLCKEFLEARTANEDPQKLKDLIKNAGYDDDEVCRPDKFFNPYCGKIYNDNSTEILAMGIEHLATDPIGFYKQDPEYFNLVRGIIQGKFKNYKKEDYQ